MIDMNDELAELSVEQLEALLDDAIDLIALSLPEDAGDDYWRALRAEVERRSQEMASAMDEDEDEDLKED